MGTRPVRGSTIIRPWERTTSHSPEKLRLPWVKQKMREHSSRECYVNLPLKTKTSIPTAHQMNSNPTQSINIIKTETNQGPVP